MADTLVKIAEGFWNVRGSFKIRGVLDIGTHTSIVRLRSGGFALLDGYTLTGPVADAVRSLTDDGRAVEAILHLHPFHTIHVKAAAAAFPGAKLYGTARHRLKAPDLPWEPLRTDDPELHARFGADLAFTVPRGVDFISADENLHFSSVLALHRASRTLHVDDTLTYVSLPLVGGLRFHPTLKKVLQPRPGAAAEFRAWAGELAEMCDGVEHLCTAHLRALPPPASQGDAFGAQVRGALSKVEGVLGAHERRYG